MKRVLVLTTLGLLATLGKSACLADADRPNILYFYVDDMGWGSIGPNGQAARRAAGKPYVRTPNLNELAAQGLNFSRGYGCHVCSPARSSQQTGFHQGHTFADRNDPDNAKKAMRADDVCMGDSLSAAGYVTGYWGKWGYGGSKDMANPTIENVQTLPTSHGYQHVLAELHHVRAHTFFQPTLWSAPTAKDAIGGLALVPNSMAAYRNSTKYPKHPALQNHADYPTTAYCDDSYAMAALDFVRTQGQNYNDSGQPFFGLLAVQIPHAPFGEVATLPEWNKAYADDPHFASLGKQTQQWAAMVTRIDAHFGNILAALDDPNGDGDSSDSIANNTLVIFQSDNGGPGQESNKQLDANGGLRGNKGMIQEGGIRVPLVMRWPARINASSRIKAGTNCDTVVDVTDLLPTFCELAGTPSPLGIDGVSIAPMLLGSGEQRHREFIVHEAGNGQSIIRGRHKLVRAEGKKQIKKLGNKTAKVTRPVFRLFDLEADPSESNDIAGSHPKIAQELEKLLIGECVAEPRGFANTYHHWTGKDGAITSSAANWSNYEYSNAGITYMTDSGRPRNSWTARIANLGGEPNTAVAEEDVEFLGLEIQGNEVKDVPQMLVLDRNINLTGRNEIRLASNAILTVDQGTVSSLRWLDILPGGTLLGSGTVDSTVYNSGMVEVTGKQSAQLTVTADYHQSTDGALYLKVSGNDQTPLVINGRAQLDGELSIEIAKGSKLSKGQSFIALTANQIEGTFSNPKDSVVAQDGTRYTIQYSDTAVSIKAE